MHFITVQSEGSLFSAETLTDIYHGEAQGQSQKDFLVSGHTEFSGRLSDEIAACWGKARVHWAGFRLRLQHLQDDDPATSETRQLWVLPFLQILGFDNLVFARSAADVGGRSYAISHYDGEEDDSIPIHIVGAHQDLDKRSPSGRPRLSPHALVQEYLNRTEHLWAIATNGYRLRFLRDAARMSRPTYLEFDLKTMMQSEQFAEFQLLYRLLHRSRWLQKAGKAHDCWLEKYHQLGVDAGGRVRDKLREGVETALKIFGNGFLAHPDNSSLREKCLNGQLSATDFYRQLLHLIYRFLFLMVSEERKLVGPKQNVADGHTPDEEKFQRIYREHYSISRLRAKVERPLNPDERFWDLWESVKQTFQLYCDEKTAAILNIEPLDSDLFGPGATIDLDDTRLFNSDFLQAFRQLSLFEDEKKLTRRVNYAYLDVEELGSVYESLLDFHPVVRPTDNSMRFELVTGTERKSTGSYYTNPALVHELIKSALEPVIADRLQKAASPEEQQIALLNLKVCDPACGSGHFLLAAARRIGKELAKVRSGEDEPAPEQFRRAVRDVITHCIYGVDLNPLAVDLCKVALWLEGHSQGVPLTFLDHRIKCGNSLVGVFDLAVLPKGIPDEAFKPVTGDDKKAAAAVKKRNKQERFEWEKGLKRQGELFKEPLNKHSHYFAKAFGALTEIPDQPVDSVQQKAQLHKQLRQDPSWLRDWTACNLWTAAFFSRLQDPHDPCLPTSDTLLTFLQQVKQPVNFERVIQAANNMAVEHNFFHWPLEFPDVFQNGGFDIVLGNPPWERIKLQEQEFFSTRAPEIAAAPNKAARSKMIKALHTKNPSLAQEFAKAKHVTEATSRFVRSSERFPLTAVGDVNTYALFAEFAKRLMNAYGRCGIIVPTGIATDDTCKRFFAAINKEKLIISLYDFKNHSGLFPAVAPDTKFCLLTLSNFNTELAEFAFFLTQTEQLHEDLRRFFLSHEDISLINPNTFTAPIFRTRMDAELTHKIYRNVPVLVNELSGDNPWIISFMRMFDMSNDSYLFHTEPGSKRTALYEAKMFWQFDHRFGSYEKLTKRRKILPTPEASQYECADYRTKPWYFLDREILDAQLKNHSKRWLIGFRRVTDCMNERTVIFSILPFVGASDSVFLLHSSQKSTLIPCIIANANSIILDYVARQKMGGINLNYYLVKQLPVYLPDLYSAEIIRFISVRSLELIYTSWDIKSFADDIWRGADEALRESVQQQWKENKDATGGHTWEPPIWVEIKDDGIPMPPFKWDEDRRALLRAELDAYYAHLYGLTRDELRYILDPQDVYGEDFPGETFRVLKEKEIKKYGEYRTRRLVLEAWDRLFEQETRLPIAVEIEEYKTQPTAEEILAMREYATLLIAAHVESALRVYAAKILYFCAIRGVSHLNLNWTLEKHGPYDHAIGQLRDRMLQDGFLERVPTQDFGKPFKITPIGAEKMQHLEQLAFVQKSKSIIESVLQEFAGKTSRDMELRATLVFLNKQHPDWGIDQLITALRSEKAERQFRDREIEMAFAELEELGYI
ncbi:N-6 DNA methylase [candidate division KSB1 bacterium]|nr:N-6 DNA methylase [candidate division KSB1 bacterium]